MEQIVVRQFPEYPDSGGRPLVFLLDASSTFEQKLMEAWISDNRPAGSPPVDIVPLPPSRRRRRWLRRLHPHLAATVVRDDDPMLVPLRVVWRAPERGGVRQVKFIDLIRFGDPRDPDPVRQRWTYHRHPERCWIVAGHPASVNALRARWSGGDGTISLVDHIVTLATLALEREERRVRGARYKVPRLIYDQILGRPSFRAGVAKIARQEDRTVEAGSRQADRYLHEIAATHTPYIIDLAANLIRLLISQGYRKIDYSVDALRGLYTEAEQYPLVFLPSHKSHLDHIALQLVLYENQLPPNHTAGGINLAFFPIGPLVRRSGVFFIRRSFKDNAMYKFVLRQYLSYLLEKRFPLEWYLEGGRSRSGKLREPRYGLLSYVVDAYRHGAAPDVVFVPVSIAYDQIQEVTDHAAEQRGASKRAESFRLLIEFVRGMRRRYGSIYLRFGEPLSLAAMMGPRDAEGEEVELDIHKLAFEVAVRINRVTPLTPSSLVTLALLGTGDQALTVDELTETLENFINFVRDRALPTTEELELDKPPEVRRAVDALVENGIVSRFDDGPEIVYKITPEQALEAAYYRNTTIHFFVNGAIAELALLRAAEPQIQDPAAEFKEECLRLRDLLKFEFFFSRRKEFNREMRAEVAYHDPDWKEHLERGGEEAHRVVARFKPFSAHWVLRPFLEAYQVVGDLLESKDAGEVIEAKPFLNEALGLGRQYYLQRRITTPESVSVTLFGTALELAENRGLLEPGPDIVERRAVFAAEIRAALGRVETIATLASARRQGLIK